MRSPTLFIIVLLLTACGLLTSGCDGKVKVETDDAGNVVSIKSTSYSTQIKDHIARLERMAPKIPAMQAEILSKAQEFRSELERGRKSSKSLGPLEDRVATYVARLEQQYPEVAASTKTPTATKAAAQTAKKKPAANTGNKLGSTTTPAPGGKLGTGTQPAGNKLGGQPAPGSKLGGTTTPAPMGGR